MFGIKRQRKRVCFLDRSVNGITGESSLRGPLNGRLTCIKNVTTELAKTCDVTVLGRHPEFMTEGGVLWTYQPTGTYDALVLVRGFGDGEPWVDAKKRILWVRDLPHSGFCPEPEKLHNVLTVCLSRYAERVWKRYYRPIKRTAIIPNGVDTSVFRPFGRNRNNRLFVFASNPDRGLDRLPSIFDALRAIDADVQLMAFSDRETLHPAESGDYTSIYESCRDAGITLRPPVTQAHLAQIFNTAGAMVIPNDYPEICSNVVLQALACGLPVITTGGLGATPEWVQDGKNGLLTEFQRHDYAVWDLEMIRNCKVILDGGAEWKSLVRGAERTPVWSWKEVGRAWLKLL